MTYSHESTLAEKEIVYPALQIFPLHLWSDTDQKENGHYNRNTE